MTSAASPPLRQARPALSLCSLTLQPHKSPVAAPDGHIFDAANITQLVRRTHLNPISGQPLKPEQLIPLIFSLDPHAHSYRCPILFTPFSANTKVVAIATSGRVYSAATITRLCFQPRYMRDLVDGTPFTHDDVIVLYDPVFHTWSLDGDSPNAASEIASGGSPSSSAKVTATPPAISPSPKRMSSGRQSPHVPMVSNSTNAPPLPSASSLVPPRASAPVGTPAVPRDSGSIAPPISLRKQMPRPTMTPQSVHRPTARHELFCAPPTAEQPPLQHQSALYRAPTQQAPMRQSALPPPPPPPPPPQPSVVAQRSMPAVTTPPTAPMVSAVRNAPTVRNNPVVPAASVRPVAGPLPRMAPAAPLVGPPLPSAHRRPGRPSAAGPPAKKPRRSAPQTAQFPMTVQDDAQVSMQALYQKRIAEEERKAVYKKIRKGRKGKGYVRVVTNIGHLNIELHCDKVPTTCDNFLTLAERKYYDGQLWHRVVPGFIAQTGDPTGKGDSGDSAWGGFVKDEIRTSLNHDAPGVVSMANSGRDTNRSQWFVCFEAARHLDGAHTVFGKVVGGLYVLKKMESEAEMGHPLTVERIEVLVNPIRQIREQIAAKERQLQLESQAVPPLPKGSSPQSTALTDRPLSNPSSFDGEHVARRLPHSNLQQEKTREAERLDSRPMPVTRLVTPELPPAKTLLSATPHSGGFPSTVKNR